MTHSKGTDNGEVFFPVLSWIRKLCQLHSRPPRYDWTLCLTLHGAVVWPEEVNEWTKSFFAENLRREPNFAKNCEEFLGEELVTQVTGCSPINFSTLDRTGQQKIIMVMVPKMIAKLVHNEGWNVSTEAKPSLWSRRIRPDGDLDSKVHLESEGSSKPDALYRAALKDIFSSAGVVTDRGKIKTKKFC